MESILEKKIEDLMQENYQLKILVDEYKGKEEWYKEEITQLEQTTNQNMSNKNDREFKQKENELKDKINSLRLELDLAQQSEKSQQDRVTELERLVEENQQNVFVNDITKVDCDETMGFSKDQQFAQLNEEISTLKAQINTEQQEVINLKRELISLKSVISAKEEEIEAVKIECTSYSNLLEKTRMENLELSTQRDLLLMEHEEQTHEKKGNSLFSELDDRRVEAEKTLMSQKKSFDMMKKKNEVLKQYNQKLKMQLFAAMGRGTDDTERVNELVTQLEQERSDRQQLLEKIQKLENQQTNEKLTERLTEFSQKVCTNEKGVDKAYIEYLVNMLKSKEEEVEELSRKLHVQNMCLLDQKNKVTEKERQLYNAETKKDEMWRKYQQIKMEKDELEMEVRPELKGSKKPIGKTETIPTGLEGVEEKNTSVLRINTSENEYKYADREWALNMMKKFEAEDKKKDQARVRSVRMCDDVDVFEADGQINTISLRGDENVEKLVREKSALEKVTVCTRHASEPKYKVDDCNTQ